MKWSILTKNDLNTLRELGTKLRSGTEWERTVGDFILEYTKDRIPIPSKDGKSKKSEKGKPMFPDSEAADEALAH
jgi:hypothetical protein